MKNEFDDELDRDKIKRSRHGSYSEPDPSDADYYLDDDYKDSEEHEAGVKQQASGRGTGQYQTGPESSPAMFRGQEPSKAASPRSTPGKVQSSKSVRPQQGGGQELSRSQTAAGSIQGIGRSGAVPGVGQGSARSKGIQGGSQGTESRTRPLSGNGQGASRPQTASGSGQGTSRPQTASGNGPGTSRPQASSGADQNTSRIRPQAGNGQSMTRSQASAGIDQGTIRLQTTTGNASRAARLQSSGEGGKNSASRSGAQVEKKKKIRRIIIMAVAEIFTLALIFSYAYVSRLMGSIQRPDDFDENKVRNEIMSPEQKKHMTGYRTIAIFGVDSRDGNVNKGTNADVIMICNINRDTGEIRLVSVFRDTYLNTGEGNTYNKINSAYATGGAAQALAALNKNLDMDISEYVTFNWKSVADGINMLGGVDIEITKAEFRYINGFITETVKKSGVPSVHLKSAGMNHLDGVQAVAYARLRKMDTDFARTERQRLVIQKAFEKAKKADLGLLNRILLMEVEQIGTNLTFSDFTELILDINKYYIGETGGFPFTRGDMTIGKRGDCVVPQTLESNVQELHKILFDKENYEPSDMVKKISAKIAADSGMYKKGSAGNEETKKQTTEAATEEKTKAPSDSSSGESLVGETDENGNPIKSTDQSESSSRETRPGETTKAGETRPAETRPGESTSGTKKPGETKPGESKPSPTDSAPEPTTAPGGPGTTPTTGPSSPAAPETTSGGPAGPGESASVPTTAGNSDVPVVSAPPV